MIFHDIRQRFSDRMLSLRGLLGTAKQPRIVQRSLHSPQNAGDGILHKIKNRNNTLILPTWNRRSDLVRQLGILLLTGLVILIGIQIIHLSQRGIQLEQTTSANIIQGFGAIAQGASSINEKQFNDSQAAFSRAQQHFADAQQDAWFLQPGIVTNLFSDPRLITAQNVLRAGTNLAHAGAIFSKISSELATMPRAFFAAQNVYYGSSRPSLTARLRNNLEEMRQAATHLTLSAQALENIPKKFIPVELRDQLDFAQRALYAFLEFLNTFEEDTPAMLKLLGDSAPHTFLILLQNNAELRPTGGFIGNYIIAETNDGYLTKNEMFDVYFSDHQLSEIVEPPAEIRHINERWYLRDSNYSAHFPLSAEKAAWFLEKENGPGVDTVIAIDKSLVEKMLTLTGTIHVPEINTNVSTQNFTTVMSFLIESKYFGREDPKVILKNFLPAFQEELFAKVDPLTLAALLRDAITEKHILAYSKDPDVQSFFEQHNLAGLMYKPEPNEDYLNIVHTSIGGNKSDDYMSEYILHDTYLNADGTLENDLTITRTHLWNAQIEQDIRRTTAAMGFGEISNLLYSILGRATNFHRLRIYVPKGSEVISTNVPDLETKFDEEVGLTYFALPFQVPLSSSASINIRYKLPFTINFKPANEYRLTAQKQAGQERITLQKRIFPERGMQEYTSYPEGSEDLEGIWKYEGPFTGDLQLRSVWGK
ncbi:hypothetical protein COV82_01080 [Candidatus Peregrinibacteria bacterium CG11_big_fil_rev_8_21_14_0_20_46_8]|nr:MAG: hypothetical protein COV82_01080 [Candidatus Peregrinibacteria bacterium CG11_big_fil_rev_8_21_14_0_20_46_8]